MPKPSSIEPAQVSSVLSRRSTVALVFAMALAGAAGLVAWGPVSLVPHMHQFADQRSLWGMPYAVNVWSHLPLLPIGLWGMWRVSRLPGDELLRWVWGWFFCCQMLATVGGMVYHWKPSDVSFIWDQVPRSAACSLFAAAFLAERIDRRFGLGPAIATALIATLLGGIWWLYSLHVWGVGDLRPLIWLELSPIALVATGAWTLHGHLLSRQDWMRSQLSFVVAQTVDWADRPFFDWSGQVISGHSMRHLALAACVGWVAWRLGSGSGRRVPHNQPLPAGVILGEPMAAQTSATSFPDSRLAS
ncbi:MAG: hypothetical protein ACOZE7_04970 [Pseudomonadota bacterium]